MKLLGWAMLGGALGSGARHLVNIGRGCGYTTAGSYLASSMITSILAFMQGCGSHAGS